MENFLKGNLTNNEINCKRQKFYYNDYILYRKKFLSIENYQKNINISTVYAINNMKVKLSKEGGEKFFFPIGNRAKTIGASKPLSPIFSNEMAHKGVD